MPTPALHLSARNVLEGVVVAITEGAVNSEVQIRVAPGVEIVAIITKTSVDRLGLAPGKAAYAVIKASDVMVAVP